MFTPDDSSRNRASLAYQFFIKAHCNDWPAAYVHLLPVVEDLGELHRCKDAIERLMAGDLDRIERALSNPWAPLPEDLEPLSQFPDSRRKKSAVNLIADGLAAAIELGLPAPVKPGFEDHPEVTEARANAHRTAIYVADQNVKRAFKLARTGGKDEARQLTDARRHLATLQKNRKAALRFVREPLTAEQIKAEREEAFIDAD